ncbi:diguanylate cyclase [Neobacillus sp. FSL H8-0543]|uniref:diguanylate cyclase domain-containing protein n=1 Tax=Neobacillus sp. FSL H8-0543 TaxID=2954672 RepID=UPI003158DB71
MDQLQSPNVNEMEKLHIRIRELEKREMELLERLRLNESLHSKVLDALPINIFLEDPDGRTIFVNEQACKAHGLKLEDLVGKTVFDFFPEYIADKQREIDLEVWKKQTLQTNEVITEFQGNEVYMLTGKTIIQLDESKDSFLLGFGLDITELKEAEKKITHMAYHDALTGLPNRWFIKSYLQTNKIEFHKSEAMLGVLMLDLDHFKVINDSLGHEAGDKLLLSVANRLRGVAGPKTIIARFGGDEFVLLLPELESLEDAVVVSEKVKMVFEVPFYINGQKFTISPSIGISVSPLHGNDMDNLIKYADIAMYHSKEKGRNCCTVYNPVMKYNIN